MRQYDFFSSSRFNPHPRRIKRDVKDLLRQGVTLCEGQFFSFSFLWKNRIKEVHKRQFDRFSSCRFVP